MTRLPSITADTLKLFKLYYQYEMVRAKDLEEMFGFSTSKSGQIIRSVRQHMLQQGIRPYVPPTVSAVPTTVLFEVYGWDIERITRKAKVLMKSGLAG